MSRWYKSVALLGALGSLAGCVAEDPFDFNGPRSCEVADQNEWLYDLMGEVYLWNEHLPEVVPADYASPGELIAALRYTTPEARIDRWSRVSDRKKTDALFNEGKVVVLGFSTKRDADDALKVAYVEPGSSAQAAGLQRGDTLVSINGYTITELDADRTSGGNMWGEVYGPNDEGVVVSLEFARGDETHAVQMEKTEFKLVTVPVSEVLEVDGRPVGYLYFKTFVATSAAELDAAFASFREAGVEEVVVDLRYNGGGLVNIAAKLINLLVGGVASGDVSYKVNYNAALADENDAKRITKENASLPHVEHVVFLTTSGSASASELVINSVRAHTDVTVVGGGTAGKPVGSRHFPFCDSVAAPITFELLNADDEGRYFQGIPADCSVGDDLDHVLGDPLEGMLAEATHVLATGQCSRPTETAELVATEAPNLPAPLLVDGIEELRGWM